MNTKSSGASEMSISFPASPVSIPGKEKTRLPACCQAGWCSLDLTQPEAPALLQTPRLPGWGGSQDTSEKLLKMCVLPSVFLVLRPTRALLGVTKLPNPFRAGAPRGCRRRGWGGGGGSGLAWGLRGGTQSDTALARATMLWVTCVDAGVLVNPYG